MRAPDHGSAFGRPAANPTGLAVEVRGVSLTFQTADGEVQALSNVDLDIAEGDFVSFIGPSGCGKTTLLRVIADLEQPTAGSLSVNGVTPDQARLQRHYGYIFQAAALLSLADHRAQRNAAAGDHGLRRQRCAASASSII